MIRKISGLLLCVLFLGTSVSDAFAPTHYQKRINPARFAAFQMKKQNIKTRNALRARLQNIEQEQSERILVIAAHPDDEILCCSNAIKTALEQEASVTVIFLTDGDAKVLNNPKASKSYGITRRKESRTAGNLLGLGREDLIFLNFPDGLLSILGEQPLRSPYTHQDRTSAGSYFPNTPYTRGNLKTKLYTVIRQLQPTTVFLPSNQDKHADHKAAGIVTKEVLQEQVLKDFPRVQEYTVHGQTVNRDTAVLDARKLDLIRVFKTQMHDLAHEAFLENFAYIKETFINWKQDWLSQEGQQQKVQYD